MDLHHEDPNPKCTNLKWKSRQRRPNTEYANAAIIEESDNAKKDRRSRRVSNGEMKMKTWTN